MTKKPPTPDTETCSRLLANLRRNRLEIEEFNLKLAEITSQLEHDIRKQKLIRVRSSDDAID